MNINKILVKIFNQVVGTALLTLGVAGIIITGLGSGPFDAFCHYLHVLTGLNQGTLTMILGVVLALIVFAFTKKKSVLLSIVAVIVMGLFIDLWLNLLGQIFDVNIVTPNLAEKESILSQYGLLKAIIVGLISFVVVAIGAAYLIVKKMILSPYDQMSIFLGDVFGSYIKGKTILEVFFMVLAIIFGLIIKNVTLQLNFMSVLNVFGSGLLINFFIKIFKNIGGNNEVKQVS